MQCSWCVTESIAGNELGSPGIWVTLAGSWPSFRTSSALMVIVDSFESSCQACSVALFGRWRRTSSLNSWFSWKTWSKEKVYRSKTGARYQLAKVHWLTYGKVCSCKEHAINLQYPDAFSNKEFVFMVSRSDCCCDERWVE